MHWAASRTVGASEGDTKHLCASLACVASVVMSPGPWGNQLVPYDFPQGPVKCGNSGPDIYRVCIRGHFGTPNEYVTRLVESGRSLGSGAFHPEPEPAIREEPGPARRHVPAKARCETGRRARRQLSRCEFSAMVARLDR
jgi:hypothetical protein